MNSENQIRRIEKGLCRDILHQAYQVTHGEHPELVSTVHWQIELCRACGMLAKALLDEPLKIVNREAIRVAVMCRFAGWLHSAAAIGSADEFVAPVMAELDRARTKFPGSRVMYAALMEEVGELCDAIILARGARLDHLSISDHREKIDKEALQCVVMAMRLILDGDNSFDHWRLNKGLPVSGGQVERILNMTGDESGESA